MQQSVIGIDIGGTMIKGGIFDSSGACLQKNSVTTDAPLGSERVLHNIVSLVRQLSPAAGPPAAVGIGIAGVLDRSRTTLLESPNLPLLHNTRMKERLESELRIPVVLENDANCAALGELWTGAGRSLDNFLFYTIGTGIGSGLILNRVLWTGEQGKAGEFGHMIINPGGAPCNCGRRGCLEAEASGSAITRRAREALASGQASALHGLSGGRIEAITPEMVYHAAHDGDSLCRDILRTTARYLAIGMANVNNLLDLHHFIIGGGVAAAMSLVEEYMREQTRSLVFDVSKDKIEILMSRLGNDAGMSGAGFLAFQHCARQEHPR